MHLRHWQVFLMGSICILSIPRIFNGSTCSDEGPHAAHLLDAQQGYLQIDANECTHFPYGIRGRLAIVAPLCLRPQALDPPQSVMTRFNCRINFARLCLRVDRVSKSYPRLCLR